MCKDEKSAATILCKTCVCALVCDTNKTTGGVPRCEFYVENENCLTQAIKISKEKLEELTRATERRALSLMIERLARGESINVRESVLKDKSPEDVCEMLEQIGWSESDFLLDGFYCVITFWNDEWDFDVHLSFNGYDWSMSLWAEEKE